MGFKNRPPISRQTQTILTLVVAIIILAVLGFIVRSIGSSSQPVSPGIGPTEDWPTPRSSVTATATPTPRPTSLPTATATPLPTPTPIIIGSFQKLGNLISVEYTLQTVVEAERERVFPLSPERIILVAVGNVEAGVDLTRIEDKDIIIEGTGVRMTLPPAAVTSIEILPGESEIFDSKRGWLLSEYEGLELEAMEKARAQLEHWAVERVNLLNQAEDQARIQMEIFLRQLGFEKIEITFKR